MLRLSLLLCAVMFTTLLIAGEDNGQMRPGLAAALEAGDEIVVLERRKAAPVEPAPVEVVEATVAPSAPATGEAVVETASYTPPTETVRKVTPEPIFTLSALPTVTVDVAPVEETPLADVAPVGEVWYVTANSVNVREGPSTETSIVDKLTRGEAVTVTFEEGSEWARVVMEGDGMEGYVALRFLAPEAP